MAGGISINVLSDVSDFVRGAKQAGQSVDDFADAIDDLQDAGKDAGRKTGKALEDGIKDGTKDAAKDVDKLETKFKDVADASKKAGKDTGDGIKDGVKKGTDGSKESLDEFKSEANSTAKESAASFDGSAESIIDSFQEIAANAFAGFGPAGALAGIAAAAGIGLVSASITGAQEDSEAFKEDVSALAESFIDAGGRGEAAFEAVASKLKEMALETDDGKDSLNDLADAADGSGRSYKDLATIVAGGSGDIEEMLRGAREQMIDLRVETKDYANTDTGMAEKADATQKYADYLENAKKKAEEAEEAEANWLRSGGPELELRASMVETYQSALDDTLGSFDEFQDAESGALDPAGYIAAIQARNDATANFNDNIQTLADQYGLSYDEIQRITDQGIDFAPMLQSLIDNGLGDEFVSQIRTGVDGGQRIINGADLNGTVKVDADIDPAAKKSDAEAKKKRDGEIKVDADTKPAAQKIQQTADKNYKATIDVRAAGIADVERRIDNIKSKTITVNVNYKESGRVPAP
jgi:hypothetical protein